MVETISIGAILWPPEGQNLANVAPIQTVSEDSISQFAQNFN